MKFDASRQPFVVSAAISILLGTLFVARRLLAPYAVETPFTGGMPLASALARFGVEHPWWNAAIIAALALWTLLVVVQLTVKYAPVTQRNYLPMQIFIIAAGGILISGETLAALVAAWLLVLSVRQFIFSLRKEYRFSEVFCAGLYLGAIPLLYAPSAVLVVLLLPIAMSVFRRSGRETVVCVAGALFAVPAAGFVYWAVGESAGFIYSELWRCAVSPVDFAAASLPFVSMSAVGVLLLVLTLVAAGWSLTHKKGARRKQYRFVVFLLFMLALLLGSVAIPGSSFTFLSLVAVPVALSVPYAFSDNLTSVISSAIYCVVLAAVLTLNLLPIWGFSLL